MFRSSFLLTAMVAVATAMAMPATSKAGFTLELQSGSADLTINLGTLFGSPTASGGLLFGSFGTGANTAGYDSVVKSYDSSLNQSTVQFSNLIFGDYKITGQFNQTNTPGSQGDGGWLTLSGLTITRNSGSASSLTLTLTATDYTLPVPQKYMVTNFTLAAPGVSGGQAVLSSYYDSSDTGATSGATVTGVSTTASLPTGSPLSAPPVNPLSGSNGSYSLTDVLTISNIAVGQSINQATISTQVFAPAPAGLVMLAGALPFAGLLRLRRRLTKAEVATVA